jgi:hypothetical protein
VYESTSRPRNDIRINKIGVDGRKSNPKRDNVAFPCRSSELKKCIFFLKNHLRIKKKRIIFPKQTTVHRLCACNASRIHRDCFAGGICSKNPSPEILDGKQQTAQGGATRGFAL